MGVAGWLVLGRWAVERRGGVESWPRFGCALASGHTIVHNAIVCVCSSCCRCKQRLHICGLFAIRSGDYDSVNSAHEPLGLALHPQPRVVANIASVAHSNVGHTLESGVDVGFELVVVLRPTRKPPDNWRKIVLKVHCTPCRKGGVRHVVLLPQVGKVGGDLAPYGIREVIETWPPNFPTFTPA